MIKFIELRWQGKYYRFSQEEYKMITQMKELNKRGVCN